MGRDQAVLRVGIRELKARLSAIVREVKRGATVMITEHGRPVARLVPAGLSLDERLAALRASGTVAWNGNRLPRRAPDVRVRGTRQVSDLVVEQRE